jgi:hypothetical protein
MCTCALLGRVAWWCRLLTSLRKAIVWAFYCNTSSFYVTWARCKYDLGVWRLGWWGGRVRVWGEAKGGAGGLAG